MIRHKFKPDRQRPRLVFHGSILGLSLISKSVWMACSGTEVYLEEVELPMDQSWTMRRYMPWVELFQYFSSPGGASALIARQKSLPNWKRCNLPNQVSVPSSASEIEAPLHFALSFLQSVLFHCDNTIMIERTILLGSVIKGASSGSIRVWD